MEQEQENVIGRGELLALTVEIVAAHIGNNSTDAAQLSDVLGSVFAKLSELALENNTISAPELTPAVPVKKSVTDDYIVCLEDGKKLKMLKRHLMTSYGMTPEAYRAKWGLRADYPMVAPSYAARRRDLAVKIGLGRKRVEPIAPTPPTPKPRAKRKAA